MSKVKNTMQVASIVPKSLLDVTKEQDYNMCLYQVVKEDEEYAEFFRQQVDDGKFVIMDNGAAEGVNPTPEQLMLVYPLVNPSEVVLPDVVYNKQETIDRTKDAYLKYVEAGLQNKYNFMAVPQGNCFSEWLDCMREFVVQENITTIGVSKFVTPKFQDEMGPDANVRLECVDAILQFANYLGRDINIHLLGCWSDPTEIGEIADAFGDLVRGTDSAIAYVFSRAGKEYTKGSHRPDNNEIDFINGTVEDKHLLKNNINNWIDCCNHK